MDFSPPLRSTSRCEWRDGRGQPVKPPLLVRRDWFMRDELFIMMPLLTLHLNLSWLPQPQISRSETGPEAEGAWLSVLVGSLPLVVAWGLWISRSQPPFGEGHQEKDEEEQSASLFVGDDFTDSRPRWEKVEADSSSPASGGPSTSTATVASPTVSYRFSTSIFFIGFPQTGCKDVSESIQLQLELRQHELVIVGVSHV